MGSFLCQSQRSGLLSPQAIAEGQELGCVMRLGSSAQSPQVHRGPGPANGCLWGD